MKGAKLDSTAIKISMELYLRQHTADMVFSFVVFTNQAYQAIILSDLRKGE